MSIRTSEELQAPKPHRTTVVAGGRRKIHTTFHDGTEMVEEYDLRTDDLVVRKCRGKTMLGAIQDWKYEVGNPGSSGAAAANDTLKESSNSPIVTRKDTPNTIEFRIRNLFYPAYIYDVSVDNTAQDIVVRTSNKKYFKRIAIPEINRLGIMLSSRSLSWQYGNNTLLLIYKKPPVLIESEELHRQELMQLDTNTQQETPGADGECKQQ
uniref:Protein DPCD n=1 Tax=Spongospora subterranea TaxID=70186 RepID=A0A0H5RS10_9EUKA|eukprot:CRZ11514.1 hypothetical protein [Spongospora subterranea]